MICNALIGAAGRIVIHLREGEYAQWCTFAVLWIGSSLHGERYFCLFNFSIFLSKQMEQREWRDLVPQTKQMITPRSWIQKQSSTGRWCMTTPSLNSISGFTCLQDRSRYAFSPISMTPGVTSCSKKDKNCCKGRSSFPSKNVQRFRAACRFTKSAL